MHLGYLSSVTQLQNGLQKDTVVKISLAGTVLVYRYRTGRQVLFSLLVFVWVWCDKLSHRAASFCHSNTDILNLLRSQTPRRELNNHHSDITV